MLPEWKLMLRRFGLTVGAIAAILVGGVVVVALIAIFGILALWALAVYFIVMAVFHIRAWWRGESRPTFTWTRRTTIFSTGNESEPETPDEQNASQFQERQSRRGSAKTIDVEAETVEYVDDQADGKQLDTDRDM